MKSKKLLRALSVAACLLGLQQAQAAFITVSAPISGNVTWRHTNEYLLTNIVYVLSNASLTIEPGTVVRGRPGQDANTAALYVTPGGKIFAEGNAQTNIIFTTEDDDVTDPTDIPLFQRGLWGGVIIAGLGHLNTSSDAVGNGQNPKFDYFEGLDTNKVVNAQRVHRFGGNNDDDNSGIFRYVSIRHGGVVFAPNREVNGLTLCAVGRGTTIDHVEAYAIADDGYEFFGGAVNTKYLVSAFNDDDGFDIDQGYNGKNQFWFVIQEPGRKDNGGEWNGEPNGIAANNAPIANYTIYNATFIGAGTNTTANRALQIREYAAPRLYNSIVTDFGGNGVRVDVRSATHLASGVLDLRDNLWWNIAGVLAETTGTDTSPSATNLFTDLARSNVVINPMLRGISRTNNFGLDPRPYCDSPAMTHTNRTAPNDGFFTPVSYKGAFNPRDLWLNGWTFLWEAGYLPKPAPLENLVEVTASITSGTNVWRATNEYLLTNIVYVTSNATLIIEPGTVVRGRPGQDANTAALYITPGGKIYADGTKARPIIFTTEDDDVTDPTDIPLFQRGLWGGVIIAGLGHLNTSSDAVGNGQNPKFDFFEGLDTNKVVNAQRVHRFGGNNDDDNSGIFRYVSIRHGGVVFAPNREVNGLTLCAVGRGTTLDHVESYAIADDGFEFFGGAVNTKYLVSAFNDDDGFDIDQGYNGKNQFWFVIQEPGRKDNGGEWNGEPNGIAANNAPIANYTIYNATFIGAGTNTTANRALQIREYAAPRLYNSIVTDFGGNGVRVDVRSATHLASGVLDLRDNLWWNIAGVLAETTGTDTSPSATNLFTDLARSNVVINPMLRGISRTNNFGLDPRPQPGSPALTRTNRTAPNDGFFMPVSYKGAFNGDLWICGWTFLDEAGYIGNLPVISTMPGCTPALLQISSNGGNVDISFTSLSGRTYRLYSTTDLNTPMALDGGSQSGTGGTLTFSRAMSGNKFFRVACE